MSKFRTGIELLKDPRRLVKILGDKQFFNWLPDEQYLGLVFWAETGTKLDLDNPKTFNEKLQWIKIHDRKPEYSTYVDKYAVREYIEKTIGEKYLIPLIGVYGSAEEIPWDKLPKQFVLKCTHGSASNIICKDKHKLDIEESKRRLTRWMNKNWFWFGREWPYKNVEPRIICEEYISNSDTVPNDLKVMCFNGEARLIELHIDRFSSRHTQDFYDVNWRRTQISQGGSFATQSPVLVPKPACFDEMLRLSNFLARDKYHVRIDWYEVNGRLYFGEITFFDGSGFALFDNPEDDLMLGSWIDLTMGRQKGSQ